jgi:hypothetical protein
VEHAKAAAPARSSSAPSAWWTSPSRSPDTPTAIAFAVKSRRAMSSVQRPRPHDRQSPGAG